MNTPSLKPSQYTSKKVAIGGIVVLVVVLALAAFGSRLYISRQLDARYIKSPIWLTESPLYAFDAGIGYRYVANARVHLAMFGPNNHFVRSSLVMVNNAGHLSPDDDSIEKPASEFRIAALGDSFTACPSSDVSWPTLAEKVLNSDAGLKKVLGNKTFKFVNFAQDGTGFSQFERNDALEAVRYQPDLVVLNFISDDISRRFVYRNQVQVRHRESRYYVTVTSSSLPADLTNPACAFARIVAVDPQRLSAAWDLHDIRSDISASAVRSVSGFGLYSRLAIQQVSYKVGLVSKVEFDWDQTNPRYQTQQAAVQASLAAIRAIASRHPRFLVLYHPSEKELLAHSTPVITEDLLGTPGPIKVVRMNEYLPSGSESQIQSWFNAGDGHPSDLGAQVYAEAVAGRIREYMLSR
jgi:hypothetical protein